MNLGDLGRCRGKIVTICWVNGCLDISRSKERSTLQVPLCYMWMKNEEGADGEKLNDSGWADS